MKTYMEGSPPAHRSNAENVGKKAILQHKKAVITAVSTAPVQRRFNIERLLQDPGKREKLFAAGIGVDDLEEVQELLEDKEYVDGYLKELEASMQEWFKRKEVSEYKYTRALDMALFEQEKKWAVPLAGGKARSKGDVQKIPAANQQEGSAEFLARIKTARPLKDVGAAVSHGEYAHRIQWYVISRSAMDIGTKPEFIRTLYMTLGEAEFEKQVDDITAAVISNTWSLWNALVDVPASVATANPQPEKVGEVGFSAPVKLTGHISDNKEELQFSQLRLAILNRRLKRYFEVSKAGAVTGRPDAALATMLANIRGAMAGCPAPQINHVIRLLEQVPDYASSTKHGHKEFSYDDLNDIAFGLCGIPLRG